MSKSKLPEQTGPEEVDLGQIFKLIGDVFNRLFNFIGSIFEGLYMIFLTFLIHIHKRLKWYGLAILLGVGLGYILDQLKENLYGANLHITTNYGSSDQVYENIKYLNQMAKVDKDSVELARILNLTAKEASTLRGFFIDPDIDDNDKIKMFVNFKQGLDSTSRADYVYKDYVDGLNFSSFNKFRIGVAASDRFIFGKLKGNLANMIAENEYINSVKRVTLSSFEKKDKTLQKQDLKVDSLLTVYLNIRDRESKKEVPASTSGTNFFMGNQQQNKLIVDETQLLATRLGIAQQRREIDIYKVSKANIVNVLADFPDAGYDISEWYNKKTFVLPIFFFCITFLGFLLIGLGQYLSEQEKLIES